MIRAATLDQAKELAAALPANLGRAVRLIMDGERVTGIRVRCLQCDAPPFKIPLGLSPLADVILYQLPSELPEDMENRRDRWTPTMAVAFREWHPETHAHHPPTEPRPGSVCASCTQRPPARIDVAPGWSVLCPMCAAVLANLGQLHTLHGARGGRHG